uniref:BTB domain-containing protein n=1 Tax=Panagrellus redivivus TaxID=6233 RepID=A0A7E4UU00_PANRE
MENGIDSLLKHIGDLYLNEKMSDVTIIIKGVKLPAHRLILVRCKYFQAMFESGMVEATSNRIELRETSIDGFKSVLKWFYTGTADITSSDHAVMVLRTAHMYEVTDLVDRMTDYFEENFDDDYVCQILNEAILLSLGELVDKAVEFVRDLPYEILEHENFKQLSTDALNVMLTRGVHEASNGAIFRAVMGWMRANPSKTAEFCDILKHVPLSSVTIEDLAKIPTDVIDLRTIIHLTIQQEISGPSYCLMDENVAQPKYGIKVIAGGDTSFFERDEAILKYKIGSSGNSIVIDLGRRFMLNSFEMQLFEAHSGQTYSYWIAVSEDNVNWTPVIDHSKYPCRSLQNLYFDVRPVRFVRIYGTASTTAFFQIASFGAFYTTQTFEIDRETTLFMPSYNVALPAKNAIISQGFSFLVTFGAGVIMQLPQPYLLDSMRVLPCAEQLPVCSYELEVSTDGLVWNHIISEENVALWRDIHFDMQPVVFVKITVTVLKELRPNAVAIVDSFDISDRELSSVLGRRDGNVYENLLKWAMQSPLNESDISTAYTKHLKPMMVEARSKL